MCIEGECKTQPIYNTVGETKGIYCSIHKKDGMINIKDKKCIHPECKKIPSYNIRGEKKGFIV